MCVFVSVCVLSQDPVFFHVRPITIGLDILPLLRSSYTHQQKKTLHRPCEWFKLYQMSTSSFRELDPSSGKPSAHFSAYSPQQPATSDLRTADSNNETVQSGCLKGEKKNYWKSLEERATEQTCWCHFCQTVTQSSVSPCGSRGHTIGPVRLLMSSACDASQSFESTCNLLGAEQKSTKGCCNRRCLGLQVIMWMLISSSMPVDGCSRSTLRQLNKSLTYLQTNETLACFNMHRMAAEKKRIH